MEIDYRDKRKPITAEDLIRGKGLNNLSADRQSLAYQLNVLKGLEMSFYQLKNSMSWKKVTEVTGTSTSIVIPKEYSELSINTKCNGKNYTLHILKEEINSQESEFFYVNNCCFKTLIGEQQEISVKLESIDGEEDVSLAKTTVFYK